MPTPAKQLLGLTLDGGWKVVTALGKPPGGSGGNFSEGYIVERDGKRAFLKALDYSRAMRAPDPAIALQALTEAYNFEREILLRCRDRRLDRVVIAVDHGTARVMGEPVQYLILELADGDARALASASKRLDLAWILRALHHVATGVGQLHGEGIAHQDVKPSNVLAFDGGKISKLGDLGCAARRGYSPPHDIFTIAGDPAYAPPELLYGYLDSEWNRRRYGCDAYLLGSMIVFFFTGTAMTPLLRAHLHSAHVWGKWSGTFDDVLPYVREAFGRVMLELRSQLPEIVRDDVLIPVRELCEPDPRLRGHPLNRRGHGNQYGVERYVAKFDLLARRAELGLIST